MSFGIFYGAFGKSLGSMYEYLKLKLRINGKSSLRSVKTLCSHFFALANFIFSSRIACKRVNMIISVLNTGTTRFFDFKRGLKISISFLLLKKFRLKLKYIDAIGY